MDNEILPGDRIFRIIDKNGNTLRAQLMKSRSKGNFWALWLENVHPLGYKSYPIEIEEGHRSILPEHPASDIRLFIPEKRIEVHYNARKSRVYTTESVDIAFLFRMPQFKIMYEVQGGLVEPGKNEIPGSASDWNTIQNFAVVRGKNGQIVW
ncbi:hypothetical protein GF407_13885 [candidate division KSB1 bacterium]|nr:hypothetical protein [candidate division KSB1 bacterium]